MSKTVDLTGQKFGRLTAIKIVGKKRDNNAWLCHCDCGKETIVAEYALICGGTKSCGCWKIEMFVERATTHGKSKTRLYNIYKSMKARCYNPNTSRYDIYGGRGIKVCDEWRINYQSFYDWAMANGYDETAPRGACTIDRIDVNGNYEPSNCRWISSSTQSLNKRNNHLITYNGETLSLSEWEKKTGIRGTTIRFRITNGWDIEKALTIPPIIGRNQNYKQGVDI